MKKAFFWFCFPFGCVVIAILTMVMTPLSIIVSVSENIILGLFSFEEWCFNRKGKK